MAVVFQHTTMTPHIDDPSANISVSRRCVSGLEISKEKGAGLAPENKRDHFPTTTPQSLERTFAHEAYNADRLAVLQAEIFS
jgi:hypothetical protein